MEILRRKTKVVKVGDVLVGGNNPISVQSMTNTLTTDIEATVEQINECAKAGADIMRVSCPNKESSIALRSIVDQTNIPIVADIHYDYRCGLVAGDNGASCLRINPGNIGSEKGVEEIVSCAKANNCSIRIGINGGSLEKSLLEKYGEPCADAMVESALNQIAMLEKYGFYETKISVKSSDMLTTVEAYRKLSKKTDYPLHVGVTEAGTFLSGTIKSAIGIGSLLLDGVGDTLRVSLSDDPVKEVKVGFEMLKSLNIRHRGVEIVSCPTCSRKGADVVKIASELEKRTADIEKHIKVCIMGCVVNGLGEANKVECGIVGLSLDKNLCALYNKGEKIKNIPNNEAVEELEKLIRSKL